MPRRVSEPNAAEREWIRKNVDAARRLVAAYGHELAVTEPLGPPALDAAWSAWFADHRPEDANVVVNALGLALGQHLVDELAMEWKVVEDEHGTELAVYGAVGEILVFPANLVAKRYQDRVRHFFVPVAAELAGHIRGVREAHGRN